jgi:hypothetical protein
MGEINRRGSPGYRGMKSSPSSLAFMTGLLGSDSTGAQIQNKLNEVSKIDRKETTDRQMRREQGYRGL